jgi:hypothetical protein
VIYSNDAYSGAVFFSDGRMGLTVTSTPIYNNKATYEGGVLCVKNELESTVAD